MRLQEIKDKWHKFIDETNDEELLKSILEGFKAYSVSKETKSNKVEPNQQVSNNNS